MKKLRNRISLVCMPFTQVGVPSLGLTQLKAVVDQDSLLLSESERPQVEILYLSHDFAKFIGVEVAEQISSSANIMATGVGDWLFAEAAFPDIEEDPEQYLNRHFPTKQYKDFREKLLKIRKQIGKAIEELVDSYKLSESSLIGLTSMFYQNVASFALARVVKRINPSGLVVMGGANCESPMGQELIKNVDTLDFVFSGHSLVSFPKLIKHHIKGELDKCHQIPGVFSRRNCLPGCSHDSDNPALTHGEEKNINERIMLNYDSFLESIESKLERHGVEPTLLFETSRGCWWGEKSQCTFCGLNGIAMNFRTMSAENARSEFESIFKYASQCSRFEAVDNIMPRDFPQNVFQHIRAPKGSLITYEVRSNFTLEELRQLSQAGVKECNPGIEALNSTSLKLIRKGLTAFGNITFFKRCLQADMFPFWILLVGIPGEDESIYQKYLEDFQKLYHLPPPFFITPVIFDRYSVYFNNPEKFGLQLKPYDFYSLIYPWSDETINRMSYKFMNVELTNTTIAMAQSFRKLEQEINNWKMRWQCKGSHERPLLFFREDNGLRKVYDSRSEHAVVYELDDLKSRILNYLEKPCGINSVQKEFPEISPVEIHNVVMELYGKGLLFHENNRYMNLVMPCETAPLSLGFAELSRNTVKRKGGKFSWDKSVD